MSTRTKRSTTIPPPPPTPKIKLRLRHKTPKPTSMHHRQEPNLLSNDNRFYDLENATDEAHSMSKSRELGSEKEKWMLEAELLRVECKTLRTEREFALKKLQENRLTMEMSLRSAIRTLVSGKNNISQGENVNTAALDREIEDLSVKLRDLQKSSSIKETSFPILTSCEDVSSEQTPEVFVLDSHYEDSLFSCSSSTRGINQEPMLLDDGNKCSGRCKAIVRKILEQVRAETEQWSQMQEMLAKVRIEMQQLQVSRDYWENRSRDSDHSIRFLKKDVKEWKAKARDYKQKANQLQLELSILEEKFQRRRGDAKKLEKQKHRFEEDHENERRDATLVERKEQETCKKDLAPLSLATQIANEKMMILRRPKENDRSKENAGNKKRVDPCGSFSPLRDIGNSSILVRDSAINLSFRNVESCRMRESFRK